METEGIILAAGFSSRAGTFKLALDFHGKTVIENCVLSMKKHCSKIYVVGGFKIEIIRDILKDYKDVQVVFNEEYENGMLSSVKKGIACLEGDRFFITPGDYPAVSSKTYELLLRAGEEIVIPTFEGRKGHPVLIKTLLGKKLLDNDDFLNLKEFINSKGFKALEVTDNAILKDIDTIADYKELLNL